jgi:hypothetical protein
MNNMELAVQLGELRLENERLRSELVWYDMGEEVLDQYLSKINKLYMSDVCYCKSCFLQGRLDMEGLDKKNGPDTNPYAIYGFDGLKDSKECIIRKCLILQSKHFGLTLMQLTEQEYEESDFNSHRPPCHICIITRRQKWIAIYGDLLSEENIHINPDLKKIRKLLAILQDGDFFRMAGVDYAEQSLFYKGR